MQLMEDLAILDKQHTPGMAGCLHAVGDHQDGLTWALTSLNRCSRLSLVREPKPLWAHRPKQVEV